MVGLVEQGLLAQTCEWIARHVTGGRTVDAGRSPVELGLSSVNQMTLQGHLEKWSGKRFPPELIWDSPSVAAMTHAIAEHITAAGQDAAAGDPTVGAH